MKMTANGTYHWHKRDNDHEFFFVLSGACEADRNVCS
jgi:mannose-6-phosphate isomerase-like protein (cupin superfamily)